MNRESASSARGQAIRLQLWLPPLLLMVGTLALYWPVVQCDFINFDDNLYLTSNAQVQRGLTWEGIQWACWNPVCWNWHPVTIWSHMLVRQIFGWNPAAHHLVNVVIHALNTGLIFLLLRQLTGAVGRSAAVAVFFGWHPLHVESVAWVAERKDVLCACFGLLSLMAYVRYARGRHSAATSKCRTPPAGEPSSLLNRSSLLYYILALCLFALGLMSKPMLVTWPFVMLLLDYWPLRRIELFGSGFPGATLWRLAREKIPFFFLAAAASVVTFLVQQHGGILQSGAELSLGARLGNALVSYCRYLEKLIWPVDLAVFYPHPGHWPLGWVGLAGVVLAGISALAWLGRRRHPSLLVGWLWYCGMLVPVSQVVQTADMAMADRWSYLPSLGVLLLVVWVVGDLSRGWRFQRPVLSVAAGAGVFACALLTRQQLGYWHDSITLFRHTLNITENNWFIHNHLGAAFYQNGRLGEAIQEYQEALRLKPNYPEAHNNLGMALLGQGHLDDAVRHFEQALKINGDYAEAHSNLGMALLQQNRNEDAGRQFQTAIGLKPDLAEAHFNLGAVFVGKDQMAEAAGEFREAVRLQPDYPNAHFQLGVALARTGQNAEAISQYEETIRLQPDFLEARNSLGILLLQQNRAAEAIREFQEVIRLEPARALSHYNLGVAFYTQGRPDEAIQQMQATLRLQPDFVEARKSLDAWQAARAHDSSPAATSANH